MSPAKRLTPNQRMRDALERIARETTGFDIWSRDGIINLVARDALQRPLEPRERDALDRINATRAERLARQARSGS